MSKQRQIILDVLQRASVHLSADEIYSLARAHLKNIGLGTVYRNLNALCQQGIIRKIEISGGPDRYDRNIEPHDHALCVKCGALKDCSADLGELYDALRFDGVEVLGRNLLVYCICKDCIENTIKKVE
ncbi:MAG: transcriptional repressor [Clostridiaceae bacterium]|nr:transcriptional repressor [Clostridiaceae bacterium]